MVMMEGSELLPHSLSGTANPPPHPGSYPPALLLPGSGGQFEQFVLQALSGALGGARAKKTIGEELDEALAGGPVCSLALNSC